MRAEFSLNMSNEQAYVPCGDNRKKPDRGSPHVHEHLGK